MIGIIGQSFDHRAFDGAYSGAFLSRLKLILETRDWGEEFPSDLWRRRAVEERVLGEDFHEIQQPALDRRLGHDGERLGARGSTIIDCRSSG